MLAWLIRLAGIITIFGALFKHMPGPVEQWLPYDVDGISRFAAVILGICLLYIAGQISRQKYTAFLLALITLGLLAGFELLHYHNFLQAIVYIALLAFVINGKSQYVVRTDYASARQVVLLTLGVLGTIILLASFAFIVIDQREFGTYLTTQQSLSATFDALTGKPIPSNLRAGREGIFLVDLLRVLFYVSVIVVLYGIFRPIQLRAKTPHNIIQEAKRLIKKYSSSSEDFFKIWPPENKHYYFYKEAFVVFGVRNGRALILDGCTGNPKHFDGLRKAFMNEARLNDWDLAVLHANSTESSAWKKLGAEQLYIGSEARVDIAAFQAITTNKHFRYIRNKAIKEGMHVEFWSEKLSKKQVTCLRAISDAWLSNDRREYQFAMGYFNEAYIANCKCAVLYKDNKPVAYLNFIPTYFRGHLSVDHMRFIGGLSNVAMHFLFLETLKMLHEHNAKTLNLGLAPLSKLEQNTDSLPERLLIVIKRLGSKYYSFSGLEQFKGKFEPAWEATYLVYFGNISKLVPIGVALSNLMTVKTKRTLTYHTIILTLIVIAAVGYSSWPLAALLNPTHLFNGLVSILSANLQPYDWVFTWLDYISAIITSVIFCYLFIQYRTRTSKKLQAAMLLLTISSLASLTAAFVNLPESFISSTHITFAMVKDPSIFIHGVASFVNTAAYTAAIVLWFFATAKTLVSARGILATSIVILVSVGFIFGQLFVDSGFVIQRIQITLYAIWLIWFTKDILTCVE